MTDAQNTGLILTEFFCLIIWLANGTAMIFRRADEKQQPKLAWAVLVFPLLIGLGLILFGG